MNSAIDIENLSLHLAGNTILDNIHFRMEVGDFVSIIGPNGAGKTSLIKCICGLYPASSGLIRIMEQDASSLTNRQRAQRISYVPQAEGKSFPFTVEEFVLMGRYTHLSPFTTISPEDKDAVQSALERTGTTPFRKRKLGTLSGGERQMVFIAAALCQNADVLVLDEPTSFLDYRHQAEVFQLLRRLNREQGHSILTVSHNVNTAARNSAKILGLKNGKNVFCGTPTELLQEEQLETIFDTRFRLIHEQNHSLPLVATEAEA
jgi:iron complex transport system ATP-binding protein